MTNDLDIIAEGGRPVPNALLRQEGESDHLAIILPGLAYTATMPLLFYSADLMERRGADILRLEYDYTTPDLLSISSEEREARFDADITAVGDAVMRYRAYGKITLIGKSLGTAMMGLLLASRERFRSADCIWLTPMLLNDRLRSVTAKTAGRSLFVIGTADRQYSEKHIQEVVANTGGEVLVIDGADHGLEIAGDLVASIGVLGRVIARMAEFVG